MISKIQTFFHLMVVGLLMQWTSAYPTGQAFDTEMSDLVMVLPESKAGTVELHTLLNNTLQRWCNEHDLPMVCEHSDFFLPSFEPPAIELYIHNEAATLSLFKCFIENSTAVLKKYDSAFNNSGNKMGISPALYLRLIHRMTTLTEDLKMYLDLNLGDNECNVTEPSEFLYNTEGQHFKTMSKYYKQLDTIISALNHFIDGFSAQ